MDWKNFFKPTVWKMVPLLAFFLIDNLLMGAGMCGISYEGSKHCNAFLSAAGMYVAIFSQYWLFAIELLAMFVLVPTLVAYAIICTVAYAIGIARKRIMPAKVKAKKKNE